MFDIEMYLLLQTVLQTHVGLIDFNFIFKAKQIDTLNRTTPSFEGCLIGRCDTLF